MSGWTRIISPQQKRKTQKPAAKDSSTSDPGFDPIELDRTTRGNVKHRCPKSDADGKEISGVVLILAIIFGVATIITTTSYKTTVTITMQPTASNAPAPKSGVNGKEVSGVVLILIIIFGVDDSVLRLLYAEAQ